MGAVRYSCPIQLEDFWDSFSPIALKLRDWFA